MLENLVENASLNNKGKYTVVDALLKAKRDNGRIMDSLDCFYD